MMVVMLEYEVRGHVMAQVYLILDRRCLMFSCCSSAGGVRLNLSTRLSLNLGVKSDLLLLQFN